MIVFDDMIPDMVSNKKLKPNPIVTELFIRRKIIRYFAYFYHAILFRCSKKYENKINPLFC